MFPSTANFQTSSLSPQFSNFSASLDSPQNGVAEAQTPILGPAQKHQHSISMHHPKSTSGKSSSVPGHHVANFNTMDIRDPSNICHHRGDFIFPNNIDTIDFCIPSNSAQTNDVGPGINCELLMLHDTHSMSAGEGFTERPRRGVNRRSNHKMNSDEQIKWSRKNISATMERFEPTTSSNSSLEYGFAAGVVTPSTAPSPQSEILPKLQMHTNSGGSATVNHVYSYAYYEPGAAKCHTNIPHKEGLPLPIIPLTQVIEGPSKSPPRNSIRALLVKSFRSKSNNGQSTSSSPNAEDRHTYTTRYGTTENLYEEVNDQKIRKVLSDNRIATSSNVGNVKEELRRVQNNHFRVLDELNLSLEALIMPPTPPDPSPNEDYEKEPISNGARASTVSAVSMTTNTSQRHRRGGLLGGATSSSSTPLQKRTISHASLENLSTTLTSMELKDHAHSSCINPDFDEGDLDSGFSGSGSSSGASYNESLRYYKSAAQTTTLPHNVRSCRSSTASGTSTSKSSMASCDEHGISMMASMGGCAGNADVSPFNYTRCCPDMQRGSTRSASATGTKPKKNFWAIKP